jgi:predicted peroxiredoxin
MARLLVQISTGPEQATRVALGLFVGRMALEQGHEVDLFFAGDGVQTLRPETLELIQGIGTGSAREHYEALASGGARLFASRLSSQTRAVTGEGLPGGSLELVAPTKLVELMFEADRVVTY